MLGRKKAVLQAPVEESSLQPSMRNANTKMIRFWHFHTDTARAGPTRLQKYFKKRTPTILRTTAPPPPPPYTISPQWKATSPEVATMTLKTINELEHFLHKYYKTKSGFTYKKGSIDIPLLSDSSSLVLFLRNPEGHICGSVISIQSSGLFGFYGEKKQSKPRILQYLCIHPLLRGRGLAGWLLAWLDTITHKTYGPCVHIGWWSSPSYSICSPLPSIVQVKYYKKILSPEPLREYESCDLSQITSIAAKRILDELLSEEPKEWLKSGYGSYIGLYNIPSKQEVYWWKYTPDDLFGCSILVGLSPTYLQAPEGQVWQVVYCSFVRGRPGNEDDISMPFWDSCHTYKYVPKTAIEYALNAQGVRVALVSDIHSQYGGGLTPSNWTGWSKLPERSKLCIYNWMPPTFQFEDCLWIAPTL